MRARCTACGKRVWPWQRRFEYPYVLVGTRLMHTKCFRAGIHLMQRTMRDLHLP